MRGLQKQRWTDGTRNRKIHPSLLRSSRGQEWRLWRSMAIQMDLEVSLGRMISILGPKVNRQGDRGHLWTFKVRVRDSLRPNHSLATPWHELTMCWRQTQASRTLVQKLQGDPEMMPAHVVTTPQAQCLISLQYHDSERETHRTWAVENFEKHSKTSRTL